MNQSSLTKLLSMRKLFLLLFIIPFFSCRTLNPNVMFQTGKDYPYASDSTTKNTAQEYILAVGDHIELHIFTNEAFKLVDNVQNGIPSNYQSFYYLIESDGSVKLPLLGKVPLRGLRIADAEKLLEQKYATYYITPYVVLRVINREVLVFSGDGGIGSVVNLTNDNTTLVEAITMAGGIRARGKAYKIKLIRGDLKNPQIFQVDLSTMEGIKKSNLTVQAKDIIYVEPSPDYSSKVVVQIAPYVSILTTFLLVFDLLKK